MIHSGGSMGNPRHPCGRYDARPRLQVRTRGATRLPAHQPSTQEGDSMHRDEIMKEACDLAHLYRITTGDTFRLQDIDPADIAGLEAEDKPRDQEGVQAG